MHQNGIWLHLFALRVASSVDEALIFVTLPTGARDSPVDAASAASHRCDEISRERSLVPARVLDHVSRAANREPRKYQRE